MRPAKPDEWQTYRDLRLRALLDSPDAFGSAHEAEATRSDAMWSSRVAETTSSAKDRLLLAFDHDTACGLIWCRLSDDEPAAAHLFQMWVDPATRGMGAGRALLHEAVSWAESVGARSVHLGVTAADTPAMRLYLACGFQPDGAAQPLREHSALMAQPMSLTLGTAAR
ncbi:GNAT family N-acetyltransferase [Acidovorax cavernicola]|uniref:GNAT family N-acetyltransferase n=1 Tax=Acidovorax cavernicola TaxID=1675792 RepID=UPI0025709EDF|nr:GNAT family N-acetyltransferase [Acidovorax cavernicola]